ncbi:hypothetical protein ACW2Q0_08445 [Nocardia sp. R16R-3T]
MSWRATRAVLVRRPQALAARPLDAQIDGRHDNLYGWRKSTGRYTAAGARIELISTAGHSPDVETPAQVAAAPRDLLANPGRSHSAAS